MSVQNNGAEFNIRNTKTNKHGRFFINADITWTGKVENTGLKKVECSICKSKDALLNIYIGIEDQFSTSEKFGMIFCSKCATKALHEMPIGIKSKGKVSQFALMQGGLKEEGEKDEIITYKMHITTVKIQDRDLVKPCIICGGHSKNMTSIHVGADKFSEAPICCVNCIPKFFDKVGYNVNHLRGGE